MLRVVDCAGGDGSGCALLLARRSNMIGELFCNRNRNPPLPSTILHSGSRKINLALFIRPSYGTKDVIYNIIRRAVFGYWNVISRSVFAAQSANKSWRALIFWFAALRRRQDKSDSAPRGIGCLVSPEEHRIMTAMWRCGGLCGCANWWKLYMSIHKPIQCLFS